MIPDTRFNFQGFLQKRQRPVHVFTIVVFVLICIGFAAFYYIPGKLEIASLRQEIRRNETQINLLNAYKRKLPRLEREIAAAEARLKQELGRVPSAADLARVVRLTADLAARNQLALLALDHARPRWNLQDEPERQQHAVGAVSMRSRVRGPFYNVAAFIRTLENTLPGIRFAEIEIVGGEQNGLSGGITEAYLDWSVRVRTGWEEAGVPWKPEIQVASVPAGGNPFLVRRPAPVTGSTVHGSQQTIRVSGVFSSDDRWRAVVVIGERSYIVAPGDVLEGMRVTHIDASGVTLLVHNQPVKIDLGEAKGSEKR